MTRHVVAGLERPAEIVIDRAGVPHIRAASRRDAFVAQGFNAARDRLWQIDLWRKRGLGLLAADFGPGYLAQDRAARLFLYRGDLAAEWAAYGAADARAIVAAFVAGINAYVALTEADPALLPPEFAAMETRPARWAAEDVVRIRSHALVRNAVSEGTRAAILSRALAAGLDPATGLAMDRLRQAIEPPHDIVVPDGLDLTDWPEDALQALKLATAPVTFSAARLAAGIDEAERWSRVDDLGTVVPVEAEGSNNWVVAPARTGTGRALMASDPHRAHALPSLRYVVHLTAPGFDVIGAGEPALPGISLGHNGRAAFSLTIAPMDQEDVFVHALEGDAYPYEGRSEVLETVRETVPVRGHPDQDVTLRFSRHGPAVWADARRAITVRSVWQAPGTAAYLGSLAYLDADTPEAFGAALAHWGAPSVNQLYADVNGRIAWFMAGFAPRRQGFDGLLPAPGDGRCGWDGFHPVADLPRAIDPQGGFVATANEMNLPAGEARMLGVGYEWAEPWRARRIRAVLEADAAHGPDAAAALQTDDLSEPARRVAALAAALPAEADLADGVALLRDFDGRLAEDSAAAALAEVWWARHLKPALFARLAPLARGLLAPGDTAALLAAAEAPSPDREVLLAETLRAALATCRALMGDDPAAWAWGRLHHGLFEHPLSAAFPGEKGWRDVGPLPKGGSAATVMNAGYRPGDFRVITGASFRMVLDVGNWDAARFVNGAGQSGDPRSPHLDDHAATWAARGYRPLLYSRAAVDADAVERIELVPG